MHKIKRLSLNLQMLFDELDSVYEELYLESKFDTKRLLGVRLYYGQEKLQEDYVYLAETKLLAKKEPIQKVSLLIIGEIDLPDHLKSTAYILFPEKYQIGEILNRVQEIFDRYFQWELKLEFIINQGGGLQELSLSAFDFFQNPLFIHDEEFNYIAYPHWVAGMPGKTFNARSGMDMLPMEIINDFKFNKDYNNTLFVKGAGLWAEHSKIHRILYVNLKDDKERYRGRICIVELKSLILPGQYRVLEYFGYIVCQALARINVKKSNNHRKFETILRGALAQRRIEEEEIKENLENLNWKRDDTYLCLKIEIGKTDLGAFLISGTCNDVETQIHGSFAFFAEEHIWVLINLTVGYGTKQKVRMQMASIIREGILKVGSSNVFLDFTALPYYYDQASIALGYGMASRVTQWYFEFQEHAAEYILQYGCSHIPVKYLYAMELDKLVNYDKQNDTSFYTTLYIFLKNDRNLTKTSQDLYIHRSTLGYRLERIAEMTKLNLDCFEVRLYLIISFRMREIEGRFRIFD